MYESVAVLDEDILVHIMLQLTLAETLRTQVIDLTVEDDVEGGQGASCARCIVCNKVLLKRDEASVRCDVIEVHLHYYVCDCKYFAQGQTIGFVYFCSDAHASSVRMPALCTGVLREYINWTCLLDLR